MEKYKIAYVVSDLKRVGPTNQTLNIIKNSKYKNESIVITLFSEPKDSMIDEYKSNDIKIECLNLSRITFILTGKSVLKNKLQEYGIELVHSYGVKPDCLCNKVCKSINIKHLITLRNYPKEDILTRMNFIKGKIALHNHLKALLDCKNVVCCSKTICDKMSKDYPNHDFTYIQNGVDVDKYKKCNKIEKENLRKKYNIDINKKVFICTNSFIPRKRIDETIEGFINSKNDNSILLLLGNGMLFDNIKDKYSNNKNIIFIGKTDKVVDYLQLSDIFVSSSESEGLPNSVLEAIACNLPVILSDIPQHLEILDELDVGVSYKLGDIKDLSECFSQELNNKSNIENSVFTMKNMSNKYMKYYERILKDE